MPDKILVVDDEQEIADLVTLYLQNDGYEVYTCYDAHSALAYGRQDAAAAGDSRRDGCRI